MMRAIVLVLFLSYGSIYGQFDEEFEEVPSTHQPHMLTSESKVDATIGETATFYCEVDDLGDYVLIWKKGRNQMLFAGQMKITKDDRINVDGTSLVISNVHPKDSGEYTCQISTIPPLELSHTLDVLYPPTVKPHPKDGFINVKEGETVSLSCAASGNPKPIIRWKHAGVHYDSSDDTNFRINSAQKSDSGEYECIADNGVGDPASAVITVEVVSAPKVYPNPRSGLLTVKEGETISISCEATGDPVPVITWKRPGGEKATKVREENKIVISEANRSHAGSYECIANNSLGIFTSAIIRVQVQYAPEITVPHSWIHAGEGTNVNITCIIRGEPIPSVMWKKGGDGQVIHGNDHYHMKTDGHLHMLEIRHLKEDDFGRYDCIASNSLSSVSENIHIIGTPQVPHFTSKPHISQGTKYTISWIVDSHTPVDEYSLMFRKKANNGEWETKTIPASDKKEGNTHIQVYQLVNLEPATSYEAVVTARNKFGWSKQSEAFVFTTKKEEPSTSSAQASSTSAGAIPAEGTTEIPIDIGNDIPIINDKHSESALSSSSTTYVNLMFTIPMVFVSLYRNLL
nr:roundabout homolog 1 isoform X2 [Parasteatoda tepidariorum]